MDELKDAKAKAGSAVNRSPNLTGDVHELGRPAQASSSHFLLLSALTSSHISTGVAHELGKPPQ